jgi:CRISPR/Cas system-associated exonuclease Cas4 (RecB family)
MSELIVSDKAISATSYSRMKVYNTCPKQAYLKYIEKIPEAERPPLPAGKEYPNDRGSRIHDELEAYVKGENDRFPPEADNFFAEVEHLRELRQKNSSQVMTEDMWCFTRDWSNVPKEDYRNVWLRVILDVICFVSEEYAVVVDYKSGRKDGNEVDHARQGQLYMLAAFLLFPRLQRIQVEFWYIDHDDIAIQKFTRKQGLKFFKGFDMKFQEMTTTTKFPSKPNMHNCRFCPYKTGFISKRLGTEGTGDCDENPV